METDLPLRTLVAVLIAATSLAACRTYEPAPLDPAALIAELETRRREIPDGEIVTLARAVALMRERDPAILEARAAWRTAQALADTPTPLPNPSLEVTPKWFEGAGIAGSARRGYETALGWALFLDGRRGLTDDVNTLAAEAARVAAIGVERTEYLALRHDLVALSCATQLVALNEEVAKTAEASARAVRRLVDAAQTTALDLSQARLEATDVAIELLDSREAEDEVRTRLAARTGVRLAAFAPGELPPLPTEIPSEEDLRKLTIRDHPALARIRAEYIVAEKELHLEIARQMPALDLTFAFEHEEEADTYALPLGLELPIFDRNQPGIAAARGRREEVRTAYAAEVSRALTAIEAARALVVSRQRRLELLRTRGLPAAKEALDLARRALDAGAADALQVLSIVKSEREVKVKTLRAEQSLFEAWFTLEEACGAPLLAFPGESGKES